MDVCATHSWEGSKETIFLCGTEKLAEYWAYNNGMDRFPYGFYLWKSTALAHWQWVYSWSNTEAAAPLIHEGMDGAVVPYMKRSLPRLCYEWVREGIDDLKYAATLEKAIAEAPKDGPGAQAAKEAAKFLAALKKFLPEYPEHGLTTGSEAGGKYTEGGLKTYFDAWREQIAEYVVAVKSGAKPAVVAKATEPFPAGISEESKTAVCLIVDKAPKVDGKLDDDAWKDAPVASGFLNLARATPAAVPTEVRMVTDGKRLFFAFHCVEPKYGEMRAYATERDSDVWMDDSVEIFLDPGRSKKNYFQVIVNWLGTIQDGENRDGLWNADAQVAVVKGKGFWDVEVAIALASMRTAAAPGAEWGLNLCRNRKPQPSETTSWTHVGHSFHNPEKFGTLVFRKAGGKAE
jgi:hypothetical protein